MGKQWKTLHFYSPSENSDNKKSFLHLFQEISIIIKMFIQRAHKLMVLTTKMMKSISIETMQTPNPNFIKFVPVGHSVLGDEGTLDIPSKQYSEVSPLAQ